jgi:hypothetical protein
MQAVTPEWLVELILSDLWGWFRLVCSFDFAWFLEMVSPSLKKGLCLIC